MRVTLQQIDRETLFNAVYRQYPSWQIVSRMLSVSARNLLDWRRGKVTIPLQAYNRLLDFAQLHKSSFKANILPQYWHIHEAASKGGIARLKKYGNFGTPEGRRRGGLASVITHRKNNTDFIQRKPILRPINSKLLAELMGILIGDGHLSNFQVSVTTNSQTDLDHALFSKDLIESQFKVAVHIFYRKGNTVVIVASSRNLVAFLSKKGMPIGNKIRNGLRIPKWVFRKPEYGRAFLRGLFDTDGCVYLDKHKNDKSLKLYRHIGIAFTSYAESLRNDIIILLKTFGFTPTNRSTQKSVYIRKQHEVKKYFKEIGSSNPKHLLRYAEFIGEVPKWS
jgi:ribosomal protein S8